MSKILPGRAIEDGSAVAQITIWRWISRFARRNVHVGIQVRSGCQAIVGFGPYANLLPKYVLIFTHLFVHSVRSDNLLSLRSIPVALALSRVLQIAGLGGAKAQGRLLLRWTVEEMVKRLSRRTRKVMGARHYPAEQRARSSRPATAHQFASS